MSRKKNKHITKITATHRDHQPSDASQPAPLVPEPSSPLAKAEAEALKKDFNPAPAEKTAEAAKKSAETPAEKSPKDRKKAKQDKKPHKKSRQKSDTPEKPLKEVFLLARPFIGIGRYIRDSWRELRQVRWPNRAATWKMTLAVFVYCAIFMVGILLLDTLFTFLFNLIITK